MRKTAQRDAVLKQMLIEYRRTMLDGMQTRIRSGRADRPVEVRDDLEHSDADAQSDIEIALLQVRADTLARIDEALARLAVGTYGTCAECDGEISERRVRALPFAARCQACQARHEESEAAAQRARPSPRQAFEPSAGDRFASVRFAGWAR
jgi:DnaK suppressor protein